MSCGRGFCPCIGDVQYVSEAACRFTGSTVHWVGPLIDWAFTRTSSAGSIVCCLSDFAWVQLENARHFGSSD